MPLPLYQNCEEAAIIVFTLFKKKTRREEADRLPAFHLEGSRARTRVSWLGANSTSQQSTSNFRKKNCHREESLNTFMYLDRENQSWLRFLETSTASGGPTHNDHDIMLFTSFSILRFLCFIIW